MTAHDKPIDLSSAEAGEVSVEEKPSDSPSKEPSVSEESNLDDQQSAIIASMTAHDEPIDLSADEAVTEEIPSDSIIQQTTKW